MDTITCRIGVRNSENRCVRYIWITSPRTGKKLEMFAGDARDRLTQYRIVGRIVAAVAIGRHEVSFTPDELKAYKKAHDRGPDQPRRRYGILGGGW